LTTLLRGALGERGQSLVEFAITLPLLLLVVTGLVDLGRAVWQSNTLAYAAREGTRYAIVHGSTSAVPIGPCASCNESTISGVVSRASVGVYNITTTVNYPDGNNDRNSRVSVDARARFVPLPSQFLLNGAFEIVLRGGSMLVIQR
jgi:Flp pilus assembly protein TadG